VKRKAANRKKRTSAQHFFLLALVIALRTPRQAQEAATQGTPISPSVFYWVGCAGKNNEYRSNHFKEWV
jgi:hypothetical protein